MQRIHPAPIKLFTGKQTCQNLIMRMRCGKDYTDMTIYYFLYFTTLPKQSQTFIPLGTVSKCCRKNEQLTNAATANLGLSPISRAVSLLSSSCL